MCEKFDSSNIFRTDSNEFAVILEDNCNVFDIEITANYISDMVSKLKIENDIINLNIAIGADIYKRHNENCFDVLKNAEYACKQVKLDYDNKKNYQLYDAKLADKVNRIATIESLLQTIDYDTEFTMNFQPQFTVDGKILVGMEALLRWNSPVIGKVSPKEFIPIAEKSGIIVDIVSWTIEKSIQQIKYWNEKYKTNFKMAINISPKYICKSDFFEDIQTHINRYDIPPSWLDFEITEISLMRLENSMIDTFRQLDIMGLQISLDDFGTGYSSFSYIKDIKIDKIKIAKELIDNITDSSGYMIVNSIIMMAKGLGIKTIAEGVEYANQRDVLLNLDCGEIQGYFYGMPFTAERFEEKFIKEKI